MEICDNVLTVYLCPHNKLRALFFVILESIPRKDEESGCREDSGVKSMPLRHSEMLRPDRYLGAIETPK
jgi:hypothetical protein